jgi:hypothetical protein
MFKQHPPRADAGLIHEQWPNPLDKSFVKYQTSSMADDAGRS